MATATRRKVPRGGNKQVAEPTRYTATVTITMTYDFDSTDIENGLAPDEWAELVYENGGYLLEDHLIELEER